MWKTLNEVKISDILPFVSDATKDGQAVHVGTDALQRGRFTQFVTVVVILTPRKGGRVAYRKETVPRSPRWPHATVGLLQVLVSLFAGMVKDEGQP